MRGRFSAFDLLKASAKSWYSSGMADRLEGSGDLSETEADFPEMSVSDKKIQNDWAPGNLQAHGKMAELVMDTVGVGAEDSRALEYRGWCKGS